MSQDRFSRSRCWEGFGVKHLYEGSQSVKERGEWLGGGRCWTVIGTHKAWPAWWGNSRVITAHCRSSTLGQNGHDFISPPGPGTRWDFPQNGITSGKGPSADQTAGGSALALILELGRSSPCGKGTRAPPMQATSLSTVISMYPLLISWVFKMNIKFH